MKQLTLIVTLVTLALPGVAEASTGASARSAAWRVPFTATDLILLLGGAIVLIAAGALARRLTKLADPSRSASAPGFVSERQPPAGLAQPVGGG
jgi:hypothetical protein